MQCQMLIRHSQMQLVPSPSQTPHISVTSPEFGTSSHPVRSSITHETKHSIHSRTRRDQPHKHTKHENTQNMKTHTHTHTEPTITTMYTSNKDRTFNSSKRLVLPAQLLPSPPHTPQASSATPEFGIPSQPEAKTEPVMTFVSSSSYIKFKKPRLTSTAAAVAVTHATRIMQ